MEKDRVIYTIHKGPKEEIRLTLRQYKERSYLDVRLWFQPPDGGEFHPTKKGITFSVEFVPEFKRGLDRVGRGNQEMPGHSNLSYVK